MRTFTVTVLGCFLIAACAVKETVFAKVGSHEIEVDRLQTYLAAVAGVSWQEVDDAVASRLMDQFLDQEVVTVVAGDARDIAVPETPGERSAMVRSLLREVCGPTPAVAPEEIARAVASRRTVVRPARVFVRQMVLEERSLAEQAYQRLLAGEDFVELSNEVSRAPNAAAGGELGFIEQGVLTFELDEVIFSLAEGEVSKVVEGPAGYHLFQVLRTVPEGASPDLVLEREVTRELTEQASRRFTRDCVDRHAHEIGVRLYPDNLWFGYKGRYSEEKDGTD